LFHFQAFAAIVPAALRGCSFPTHFPREPVPRK